MIVYGALMPHPPIIIPEIGRGELSRARPTVEGVTRLASELASARPELLVFLTPHGNVFRDTLSVLDTPTSTGDFANFGHREIGLSHPGHHGFVQALLRACSAEGIPLLALDRETAERHGLEWRLDHGVLVPLYYLDRAGTAAVPVVAISIAYLPREVLYRFGAVIAATVRDMGLRTALVASGDMSHRLSDQGPYSFHPDGPRFDQRVQDCLRRGDVQGLLAIPQELEEGAGECGYRSLVILMGALDGVDFDSRVFSYEGPFGVGYLVAGFRPGAPNPARRLLDEFRKEARAEVERRRRQESAPVRWARESLEAYVRSGRRLAPPEPMPEELREPAAAFVSIKKHGRLRGCIGTIQPVRENLALEIRENAISAGTADYRFDPVSEAELEDLTYSVDILGRPEPVESLDQLDPRRYGIIVRSGRRTGVLLPDLEGVDTVEDQVAIALEKAGISPDEPYRIERFEVRRCR
ncbi:MAG: AmmeMemoRadiSam system protein A [Syntrophomonadaceae bacterium]|nr:AmmeMemoRadiSam system protein A [Syntrophomonadaceae bacterium]MDH7497471.1 AmmeMemoRadiSam system protein A [Syntrophomonadaceae bacterium]